MENAAIRIAFPSEKKSLEELQLRASLSNAGDREAVLGNPDAIELPMEQIDAGDVFVLEISGRTAGFAAVLPRADGDMDLDGLFVEPEMQRRGAGRRLVEHCAQIAQSRGCGALYVVGNPHAERFYLSHGFELVGLFETRFGPAQLMRKPLPAA